MSGGTGGPEVWRSAEFETELRRWVADVAGPATAIEQVKVRPWAAVWRVHTRAGVLYAKQNCSGQSFEAALLATLAEVAPAYVVRPVAVDLERGLLLTPDRGRVFAETVAADDLEAWCRLVRRAMQLARELQPHTARLTAAGLTDCRVPPGLTETVGALRADVAALGLRDTFVHNDLHERNAFDLPQGLVFFDVADAVLGHPLSGLLIPLDVLAHHLGGAGPEDPRLRRVADAALEVWSDVAPASELRRALPAALGLGRLCRAESWARIIPDFSGEALDEYGTADAEWWGRVADPPPVRFA